MTGGPATVGAGGRLGGHGRFGGRGRLVAWVAVLVAAAGLLAVAAFDGGGAETDVERVQRLSGSFACPECRGESVAESNAAVAGNIRAFIADEVSAGSTDQEIRDQLVRSYGVEVLLTPPAEGFASLVWVLPVLILVAGAAGVAAFVTRSSGRAVTVTDADRELVGKALAARSDEHPDS